jgi:hypothetical protein
MQQLIVYILGMDYISDWIAWLVTLEASCTTRIDRCDGLNDPRAIALGASLLKAA